MKEFAPEPRKPVCSPRRVRVEPGWWLCVLGILGGCGGVHCPSLSQSDAVQALRSHADEQGPIHAIRARARVDQRGRQGRIRGTVWMFVERPDRVRFDTMTQLGPAAVLTSDGQHFALSDLREGRFLEGPACPDNIARLLGISLSSEQMAQLLLGGVPMRAVEPVSIGCAGADVYRLEAESPDGSRSIVELQVSPDGAGITNGQRTRLIRAEARDPDGGLLWRASYDNFQVIPASREGSGRGVAMPHRVHFVQPGFDTLIRFEEIVLDPEIPDEVFTQEPVPGTTVEHIECEPPAEPAGVLQSSLTKIPETVFRC